MSKRCLIFLFDPLAIINRLAYHVPRLCRVVEGDAGSPVQALELDVAVGNEFFRQKVIHVN